MLFFNDAYLHLPFISADFNALCKSSVYFAMSGETTAGAILPLDKPNWSYDKYAWISVSLACDLKP